MNIILHVLQMKKKMNNLNIGDKEIISLTTKTTLFYIYI